MTVPPSLQNPAVDTTAQQSPTPRRPTAPARRPTLLALLGVALAAGLACCSPQAPSPEPQSAASAQDQGQEAGLDPEVREAFRQLLTGCARQDHARALLVGCSSQSIQRFQALIQRKTPAGALHSASLLLAGDDPRLQTAVAARLTLDFLPLLTTVPEKLPFTEHTARRLLQSVDARASPQPQAALKLIPVAVQAATLILPDEELRAWLGAHTDNPLLKAQAVRHLLVFGHPRLLPLVQTLAHDRHPGIAAAALSAPRDIQALKDQEKIKICRWGQPFLSDDRPRVAAAAGSLMLWCQGPWIDALLHEGHTRLQARRFGPPFSHLFRQVCPHSPGPQAPSKAHSPGSPRQCGQTRAFLELVLKTNWIPNNVRGQALDQLLYQSPPDQALATARRYLLHQTLAVRTRARDAERRLTGQGLLTPLPNAGPAPEAPPPSPSPPRSADP